LASSNLRQDVSVDATSPSGARRPHRRKLVHGDLSRRVAVRAANDVSEHNRLGEFNSPKRQRRFVPTVRIRSRWTPSRCRHHSTIKTRDSIDRIAENTIDPVKPTYVDRTVNGERWF